LPVQGARADRDRGIRESNSGRKRSERSTTRFILKFIQSDLELWRLKVVS